jgi:uncharacterized membrane protein
MRASLPLGLAVSLLLLAACGRSQDSNPAAPPAPADAPPADAPTAADFGRPLNALGDQPFWALKIRPEGLIFSTTGAKDTSVPNPGPKLGPGQAIWSTTDSGGRPLSATLKASACQDPVSGRSYPFTATVEAGGRTLHGCAVYAEAPPGG